ncbi:MAG TPA: bifunctional demethylmenaquinone methyltransferase/2-methoxy-6-polyprenyl-1,4-benzoquinol methylase UbiE [Rikenellaceae bacterium]|nr:bifunctional demethylmenaquinone methyltransferase/2-methoxy-6-polyprenyl-1,4-benzoquinol methylase UbiE [Rikenellaceae bacterium]
MPETLKKDRNIISAMFNNIAGSYDFLNHLLSLGIDKIWRKKLIKHLMSSYPAKVLDLATGTGDIAIELFRKGIEVTGIDIAQKMLDKATEKCAAESKSSTPLPVFILASADEIPFPENSFDAVTIGFGIRNFENREQSLKEIFRVTNNGGQLAILEFASPKNRVWRALYTFYFHNILPVAGKIISKDMSAYTYLPESVSEFPQYDEFCGELRIVGFTSVHFKPLSGGVAVLYTARKERLEH